MADELNLPPSLARRATEALEQLARGGGGTHRQFGIPFEPYFKLGDTAHLLKSDGEQDVLIDGVDSLPSWRKDFGALSAASSLSLQSTELQQPDGHLAQYRFSPTTGFWLEFATNSGTSRQWRSNSQNYRLPAYVYDMELPEELKKFYFAASEFWVFEQQDPRFDAYRIATVNTRMQVDFWGWRYHFRKINQRGQHTVRVNGWPA